MGYSLQKVEQRGFWRLRRVFAVVAVVVFVGVVEGLVGAPPALAACGNPVACENALPGDPPSDWQVNGIGDTSIQGYATSMSVNVGQTESFKIKTPSTNYHVDILRLGYYGGNGARKVASNIRPTATLPQTQPACQTFSSTGLVDCGNWSVSASWTVPADAVSGVYIAHLVRDDSQGASSQIPFVVRNDASQSKIVVSTSDATWQAYNAYGGNSLYTCTVACPPGNPLAYKAAYSVSYNRPWDGSFPTDAGQSYLYYAEYQMIRFLEENGYDVSYVSDSDLDRTASVLTSHKLFISSGHDEYWSGNEVANVKAARAAGVNMAFFSGNEMFWKTRWGPSQDGSNAAYRTLTTYKETHFNAPTDPSDPPTWTGAWADPRFSPPADGGYPTNALTGQEFLINSGSGDLTVPSQYSKLRFWRNTAAATLASGTSLTLARGNNTLGYEWDVDTDNGWRPGGEFDLSSTTLSGVQPFVDYGSTVASTGTATHHLSLYRAPSGALVFGAGTVQWAWGLDETNAWSSAGAPGVSPPDRNMQQATVNLFADMGVQPATLLSGLTAATQSPDTAAPVSTITSPSSGANLQDGSQVTISGSATDSGGGVVAGVEVSTDGGNTWHPATLTTPAQQTASWTYTWIAHGNPSTTVESRAVDDSANMETPSGGVSVNVACPCSLWGTSVTPATAVPGDPNSVNDSGDGSSITVGVKFTSDTFGQVSGLRFYKASANTGTHVGSVWSASGQLLASATFTGETASGWQTVTFSKPVTVLPNTTYVAGYFAPNGHYSATTDYFFNAPAPTPLGGSTLNSGPLHTPPNTTTANGVFTYNGASSFPTNADEGTNYWVDVLFAPAPAPGQVTGAHATAGNGAVFVTWNAPTTGGPSTTYTVTPYDGTTALSPTTVTGAPAPTGAAVTGLTPGTSYTFTVTAGNPVGTGPPSAASNAVSPSATSSVPTFIQQVTAHGAATSLSVTPTSNLTVGNRMVVLVGTWNSSSATAATVTDSAGDPYVELAHWTASEQTEMSVWSTPVWGGGGTRPTITVTPTSNADVGIAASEYSGLSAANDASVVDQSARATGTTVGAATVSSGATAATTSGNELALGVYVDSGFADTLTAGSGWTQRSNVSNAGDMELVSEDQALSSAGAKPNASVGTGPSTTWQVATLVLKGAPPAGPTVPSAPTGVTATAGNASATVNWAAPADGGSAINTYTITPYIGSTPQTDKIATVIGSPPATGTTVTGLTNGTAYTFTVTATNGVGTGPASTASNAVTPSAPTVPGAPTAVTATAGNTQATVSWNAPSTGSPITSYTITPYIGGTAQTPTTITGSPPATSTTITGLTNGTAYTFTVIATNAVGSGQESSASNTVTPATAPAAPTNVSATAGNAQATVTWSAPSNGGSPITSYTITPYIGSTAQSSTTINGNPPATSATIIGLTNGTAYTFKVTATNAVGLGAPSGASNTVTPATVPGKATNVSATAANAQATVTWTAPSNGGSPITSYTITPYIGSTAQSSTTINGNPPATTATITGLTNGTTYTFTVTATNAVGAGQESAASNAVTPSVATVTPAFVQQITAHVTNVLNTSVTPTANVTAGDRMVVLVGVWSNGNATAKSVTDAAGNTYVEAQHFKASDQTELSVWTAPISAGGGTAPKITVTPTARADVGVAAVEYSGLSAAPDATVIDRAAQNSGTTGGTAATVSSGATTATSTGNELALGLYVDSGFNDTLTAGTGFTSRANVSKTKNMELLVEDQLSAQGATPNASAGTGANTVWLMSTLVFKHG
jgi:hypothetical protein